MAVTTEIAPNIYRISVFAQWSNLQFKHFLVNDDEPLLFQIEESCVGRMFVLSRQAAVAQFSFSTG